MHHLKKPTATTTAVFDTCISKVKDKNLRQRLAAIKPTVASAATAFENAAANATLHQFANPTASISNVSTNELINVYTSRMVPKTSPGRQFYEAIMLGAPNGTCPLCGVGQVKTLDHHLPKAMWPVLSVVPLNLVPACSRCQTEKGPSLPQTAEEQTLHPYFDDFSGEIWLHAKVKQTVPAVFSFEVQGPNGWSNTVVERIRNHMKAFDLYSLFSMNAANELSGIRTQLSHLYSTRGSNGIVQEMTQTATSWERARPNCWQAAMYRCASKSDWFCNGGFANE